MSENNRSLTVVDSLRRRIATVLLICWAAAVAFIAVYPPSPGPAFDALPWWAMVHYIPFKVDPISFTLNIVMFMPFGVLLPILRPQARTLRGMVARSAAASATIEFAQLILDITIGMRRTADINDLISNVAGGLAGLALYRLAATLRRAHGTPRT